MHVKKVTQKDRYGNTMSYEFEVPEKGVDQTKLMEKAMELGVPPMTDMSMDMEMSMGDPMSHPGGPRGSDTVPAWLTPGEFVVNAEAMSIPGVEEQITNINNAGRAMQQGGMAMGYQQGGKVAKAIGQLVQQQKDEVPFLAGPMLTDESMYRADGGAVPVPMLDALLHSREGYRDDVYLDSLGKPTVGAGHLLPNEYKERVGERPFTKAQLDAMFDEDRKTAEAAAQRNVSPEAWGKLNKRQQATLASMAFQLGEKGQSKFKNMLKAIEAGDYTEAAKQAVTGSKGGKSKWLKQTPVRALDLAEAFDPNIAAMYRNAGGAVYDDRDAQYAFWGKKINPVYAWRGLDTAIADATGIEAGVVQYSPQQQMLNDFIAAGYSPEEAVAATKEALATANVPEDAPPIPQSPQPVPAPDTAWADNLAGIDWSLPEDREGRTIEGDIPAPTPEVPAEEAVPEIYNDQSRDWGLLGKVFGGTDIAQIEHEERTEQQNRAAIADNAAETEAYATAAIEAEAGAEQALEAGDYQSYGQLRADAERNRKAAEASEAEAPALAEKQAADEEGHANNAIKREVKTLDQAMDEARKAGDDEALATLQEKKDEVLGGGTEEAPITKPEGETPETDPAVEGDGSTAADDAMAQATAQERTAVQNEAKSIFSDLGLDSLFDGKELARMAVMYAGSRLLGYGHGGSLNWAAKNYISRVDAKEAGFSKLALSGKYKPESLAKFKKSGNYSDLEPVGAATTITGNTMTRTVGGKRQVFQEVKVGDNTLYRTPDGSTFTAAQIEGSTQPYEAAFEKGTPEYRARRSRATGDAAGRFEEVWKAEDTIPGGRDKPDSHFTNIRPKQAADEFWGWSESMGLDPESDEALQIMTNAYQQAIADGKTGEVKPSSLKPYLEQQYIREKSGRPELFMTNEPKPGERPKYIRGDKMAALDRQIKSVASAMPALRGLSGKDAADRFYSLAADEWAGLTEEEQKTYKKSAGNDESGFYIYLQQRAADLMSQTQ